MPERPALETPASPELLYLAVGGDAAGLRRPAFTGDVVVTDAGLVTLVQHPCAMRFGGRLNARVLACETRPRPGVPSDWAAGHYKRMFLPELLGEDYSVEFNDPVVLAGDAIKDLERLAVLTQLGVNLLLQRWVYHFTRVVVPTITILEQVIAQFDEADETGDAYQELTEAGFSDEEASSLVQTWFDSTATGRTETWRAMFTNRQSASTVRRALRTQVRAWIDARAQSTESAPTGMP